VGSRLGAAALGVALSWAPAEGPAAAQGRPTVQVIVPELSARARDGRQAFDAHCARCHGAQAAGSAQGPPLVHRIYQPRHHGDAAFELAVKRGTRAHHWRFGDMPPQPQVSDEEIASITRYVRELQRANGIR